MYVYIYIYIYVYVYVCAIMCESMRMGALMQLVSYFITQTVCK
jgi:hypothetical protein